MAPRPGKHGKQDTEPPALALTPPSSCPSGLLCLPFGGQPAASSPSALCSRPWILDRGRNEDKKLFFNKEEKETLLLDYFTKGNLE